jgi:bifunctional non-homologous end joining protein LigD
MSLLQYRRKRDFAKTPEPEGKRQSSPSGLKFVVQKHAARRLHYDFRLELDGTLKSWAVPKGPSLDPADKRLAVHVEDHPLAYGGFEGVIPDRQYGAGAVVVWDRGTWSPHEEPRHGYKSGHLKFHLDGEKLHGDWALVRMQGRRQGDKENWLLIKEKDAAARPGKGSILVDSEPASVVTGRTVEEVGDGKTAKSARKKKATAPKAKAKLPTADNIEPQLATLVVEVPESDDWIYELKFDGYRILAQIDDGVVRLFTRNHHDWTARFPDIAKDIQGLPVKSAWLDGEVCVFDPHGVSSFGALQRVLAGESSEVPMYMLFDLLFIDGEDLRNAPLLERKQRLAELLKKQGARSSLRLSPHSEGDGGDAFRQACAAGLEGLVGKRPDGAHVDGRSRDWIKLKCKQRQEFVIAGFTRPAGNRAAFGALLLGIYEKNGELRYAGRVGTGFDDALLKNMLKRLQAIETDSPPIEHLPKGPSWHGVRWVRPQLVAEVSFAEWTSDGLLRQAVFEGLREDKPPRRVTRERTAAAAAPRKAASVKRSAPRRDVGVAGVVITHADRVVFPDSVYTKLDVARYYEKMAPQILPYIKNRPLSIVRCPSGARTECFFQKHAAEHDIEGVKIVSIEDGNGANNYLLANSVKALVGLAQMGTIELHIWGATMPRIEQPDTLVFDLDPDTDLPFTRVIEAAKLIRVLLDTIGLRSFVKTTGGKGLHVVVPLARRQSWDEAKDFAKDVASHIATTLPDLFTAQLSKARRKGKIFIDYLRNGRGATAVAPYSLRARAHATVAMPIAWNELRPALHPDAFNLGTVPDKVRRRKDPWADYGDAGQAVTAKMRATVSRA